MSEPDWAVEATPDDPTFTHSVGFSDRVAHEREDLVSRATEFLAALPGIERAVHEDREMIGLVASGVDAGQIARQFGRWWNEVSGSPSPWADKMKHVGSAAHTVLKPAGFRKRGQTFNRQASADVWHVVELRRVGDDTGRIDIGIFVDGVDAMRGRGDARPAWISEAICHIRDPLGGRQMFGLDDATAVASMLADEIVPALEGLRTRSQLRAAADDGRRKLGMNRPANVVMAALLAMDGDNGIARAVLQQTFDDANRRARPGILAAGEHMGLEPLTTGADPTLTAQDEALLAEWSNRQHDRLGHFQRLLDARPLRARSIVGRSGRVDLSAGRRAIPGLWRWLVERTPDWGTSDVAPSLPARYASTTYNRLTDGQRALGELLVSVMFDIAGRDIPGVVWDYDMNGELAIRGRRILPILVRGEQIVGWLLDPPPSVAKPETANMLESRIDWLVRELAET